MSRLFGKNKDNKIGAARPVITFVVLVLAGFLLFTGEIRAEAGDTDISIKSFMFNETISYDDIVSLDLRESFNKGRRTFGLGGAKISSGTFSNEEFGAYRLCVYNDVEAYIVIRSGGKTTVFNLKTAEETRAVYSSLRARLDL
jgi:hypothetical protein